MNCAVLPAQGGELDERMRVRAPWLAAGRGALASSRGPDHVAQEYHRDLEQQAADVADEIRRLQEGQQPAS
jgi:hypothetical protein